MRPRPAITKSNALPHNNFPCSNALEEPNAHSWELICALQQSSHQGICLCLGCEASAEGILTAIALTYFAHIPEQTVRLTLASYAQPCLGERYVAVPADVPLALRVFHGFIKATRRCHDFPQHIYRMQDMVSYIAANVSEPDMPEALHRYIRCGFNHGSSIGTHAQEPWVAKAEILATSAAQETEHARQFVRFSRLADGSFFAVHRPKCDVIPLAASYFKRRMGTERFCLLDPVHGSAALYAQGHLGLMKLDPHEAEQLCSKLDDIAADEAYIRAMWKGFYTAVAVPFHDAEQRGYDLRQHFMPKRLWAYLPEIDPRVDSAWTWIPERYRGTVAPQDDSYSLPCPKGVPTLHLSQE